MNLDPLGKNLLTLLVQRLESVTAGKPETYIGYKECHDLLGIEQVRERWGESLKAQGLLNLAEWTHQTTKPAITGIIISTLTYEPGKGYFNLFEKDEHDYAWWKQQVVDSKTFDWSSFINQERSLTPSDLEAPEREDTVISRIIRDSSLSKKVKILHNYKCQVCGIALELPAGQLYAEAHHIKPLGEPHGGPDTLENMVCLCPNHHALLDYGAIEIYVNKLRKAESHTVSEEFIKYHNVEIYKR